MRLLLAHPEVSIQCVVSKSYAGKAYGDVYSNFRHEAGLLCSDTSLEEAARRSDLIFCSMPHGVVSGLLNGGTLSEAKVIDLGADYRFQDAGTYESWYGVSHQSPELLPEAVYGLCELNRERIQSARLVANPGCYASSAILALYPLLRAGLVSREGIVIDSKSGVSGAGRGLDLGTHFDECDESVKAYKIASHRHTPEIEEQLGRAAGELKVTFTPHLIPMNRGILSTIYAKPARGAAWEDIQAAYESSYGGEFFIRLTKKGVFPETRWVKGSNFCDIGFALDERTDTLVVISALDNLVKGAAGQAVQNMNLMFGFKETLALEGIPVFPA